MFLQLGLFSNLNRTVARQLLHDRDKDPTTLQNPNAMYTILMNVIVVRLADIHIRRTRVCASYLR